MRERHDWQDSSQDIARKVEFGVGSCSNKDRKAVSKKKKSQVTSG
jgi:hypothetical protein